MNQIKADWVAVDWGTSNVRVWAMSSSGEILAQESSDDGMNTLSPDDFESVLLRLIGNWLPSDLKTSVFACGMVGAKQGWVEASYQKVPCAPHKSIPLTHVNTRDHRISVFILPGLMQAKPADVMRGEECQVAGLLSENPDANYMICLPGTHSKWVQVTNGKVQEFNTYMTGEVFSLLSKQSVLRHSVSLDEAEQEFDEKSFYRGVDQGIKNPGGLNAQLFSIRAESILNNLDIAGARSLLSGLLIGVELSATQSLWREHEVTLIGSDALSNLYAKAIRHVGGHAMIKDATAMTLAGLTIACKNTMEAVH